MKAADNVTVALWANRYTTALGGFNPTALLGTGTLLDYIVDFGANSYVIAQDIATVLTWPTGAGNILEVYQPDWIPQPENTAQRPTDWTDCGSQGNKLVRGMLIEADTQNVLKPIQVQRSDDDALFTPNESPAIFNGQNVLPFTFTPFVGHMLRVVPPSTVNWRLYNVSWFVDLWVEYATLDGAWTNLGVQGAKYIRGLVLPMDTQGLPATLQVVTSDGATVTFTATYPNGLLRRRSHSHSCR